MAIDLTGAHLVDLSFDAETMKLADGIRQLLAGARADNGVKALAWNMGYIIHEAKLHPHEAVRVIDGMVMVYAVDFPRWSITKKDDNKPSMN